MKKNIVLNKYYKNLRENIFEKLEIQEFFEVYSKFKKLNIQYKLLRIAEFFERICIPSIDVPVLRIFHKITRLYSLENIRFSINAY